MIPEQLKAKASAEILEWKRNPIKFIHDNFGVEPEAWQLTVLKAFSC
jgi:hypothetical protein